MTDHITKIDGESLGPIDHIGGDRPQLLVFSASWCKPCQAMAPAVEDVAEGYAQDVAFAKIDIEGSPELAKAFDVRSVPTLILRRQGEVVRRHVGTLSRAGLASLLEEVLTPGGAAA